MLHQDIETPRSTLKNKVFWIPDQTLKCLMFKLIIKCGENKGIKLPKLMQIKTGSDFLPINKNLYSQLGLVASLTHCNIDS